MYYIGVCDHPRNGITRDDGLFGKPSGYYGTVEQQGILWIMNSLTPQEIRDKIMDEDCAFQ